MLDGIACRLYINGESGGRMLCAPATAKADHCVNQSLLWYAVEEADKVIVDSDEVSVFWHVVEMGVQVLP